MEIILLKKTYFKKRQVMRDKQNYIMLDMIFQTIGLNIKSKCCEISA